MTNKEKRFLHRIQKLSLIEVLNGTSSNDDLINRHSCVSLTIKLSGIIAIIKIRYVKTSPVFLYILSVTPSTPLQWL
jgi:hypothetical protein